MSNRTTRNIGALENTMLEIFGGGSATRRGRMVLGESSGRVGFEEGLLRAFNVVYDRSMWGKSWSKGDPNRDGFVKHLFDVIPRARDCEDAISDAQYFLNREANIDWPAIDFLTDETYVAENGNRYLPDLPWLDQSMRELLEEEMFVNMGVDDGIAYFLEAMDDGEREDVFEWLQRHAGKDAKSAAKSFGLYRSGPINQWVEEIYEQFKRDEDIEDVPSGSSYVVAFDSKFDTWQREFKKTVQSELEKYAKKVMDKYDTVRFVDVSEIVDDADAKLGALDDFSPTANSKRGVLWSAKAIGVEFAGHIIDWYQSEIDHADSDGVAYGYADQLHDDAEQFAEEAADLMERNKISIEDDFTRAERARFRA